MTITISPTAKIVQINDVPARVWQGHTNDNVPVTAFITRISPDSDQESDQNAFREALQETVSPTSRVQSIPLHLIL